MLADPTVGIADARPELHLAGGTVEGDVTVGGTRVGEVDDLLPLLDPVGGEDLDVLTGLARQHRWVGDPEHLAR